LLDASTQWGEGARAPGTPAKEDGLNGKVPVWGGGGKKRCECSRGDLDSLKGLRRKEGTTSAKGSKGSASLGGGVTSSYWKGRAREVKNGGGDLNRGGGEKRGGVAGGKVL